jgi:hypothetical protein
LFPVGGHNWRKDGIPVLDRLDFDILGLLVQMEVKVSYSGMKRSISEMAIGGCIQYMRC